MGPVMNKKSCVLLGAVACVCALPHALAAHEPTPFIAPATDRPTSEGTASALFERSGIARVSRSAAEVSLVQLRAGPATGSPEGSPVVGQSLEVRLPGEAQPRSLLVQAVSEEWPGIFSYRGTVDGIEAGDFVISVNRANDDVVGKIHIDTRLFTLLGTKGAYELSEIETTLSVQDPGNDSVVSPSDSKRTLAMPKAATQPWVRVLVVVGDDVPSRVPPVQTFAANIIAQTNSIISSSGIPSSFRLQLAGVELAGNTWRPPVWGSTLARDTILYRIAKRLGEFATIDARMDALKADMTLVLFSANDNVTCPGATCSIDRVGGVAHNFDQTKPFATVADTYALGDLTAPHEIGHVLGGQHQGEPVAPLAQPFAHGKLVANTWLTVMGRFVSPGCAFYTLNQQPACPRIGRYSNPSLMYGGIPTGDAGIADMAQALQIQMPIVAAYHAESVAVPGPVGTASLQLSGAQMSFSWSAATGSPTLYEAESAWSPVSPVSALGYSQIYSGAGKSVVQTVAPLRWYGFRVRGCNASGCGPYTQVLQMVL